MSHYKPYPAYKDSGVEWLGKVPEHWEISQMKSGIKSLQNGVWGEEPTGGPDDVACARVADFDRTGLVVEEPLPTLRRIPKEQRAYKNVRPGDLLLEKSGGGDQTTVGAMVQYLGISEIVCSNFVAAVKCKEGVSARWLCYANAHLYYLGVNTRSIKQTTGIQNLDSNQYSAEPIAFPAYVEQQTIAAHLDRETTRIDTLIAKKTRFIELLKEKRQALITQAVTKGLNPNVKMKDSGVEWLGEVPEHWNVRPIKFAKSMEPNSFVDGPFGSNLKSEHFIENGDVYVIESNFATQGVLIADELKTISYEHFASISRSEVKSSDIVIAKIGAQFGKCSILPSLDKLAVISGNSLKLTLNHDICSQCWGYWQLVNLKNIGAIDDLAKGGAQPALSLGELNSLKIAIPPRNEQENVLIKLSEKLQRLDGLMSKTQLSINLLKERRSALITAAVTGHIDLREAA